MSTYHLIWMSHAGYNVCVKKNWLKKSISSSLFKWFKIKGTNFVWKQIDKVIRSQSPSKHKLNYANRITNQDKKEFSDCWIISSFRRVFSFWIHSAARNNGIDKDNRMTTDIRNSRKIYNNLIFVRVCVCLFIKLLELIILYTWTKKRRLSKSILNKFLIQRFSSLSCRAWVCEVLIVWFLRLSFSFFFCSFLWKTVTLAKNIPSHRRKSE